MTEQDQRKGHQEVGMAQAEQKWTGQETSSWQQQTGQETNSRQQVWGWASCRPSDISVFHNLTEHL